MSSKSKLHKSLNVKLTWQYFLFIVIIRNKHTARKVAWQVKALAAQPDDLSVCEPGRHSVEKHSLAL